MTSLRILATAAVLAARGALMGMPIPPDVKQSVVFIYVNGPDSKLLPNGTGFFVAVPDATNPDRGFGYLVTAGHVLRQNATGPLYPHVFIRLNRNPSGTELVQLPLKDSGDHPTVYLHPDTAVDLAVIPVLPDQSRYKFKFIPEGLLPTDEDFKAGQLSEGADVFFTGLFVHFVSDTENIPIVRFGRVALSTSQRIPWNGRDRDLLLIESSSFGGNSGSPVFFYLGADRSPGSIIVGSPLLKLAGIMMGAYQDIREVQTLPTASVSVTTSNMGIAAVVPAKKLRELLQLPALVKLRASSAATP